MKKVSLLATAALGLALGSCKDSKFEGFTKAENGLHYRFFNHDENGTKIQEGDGLILRYVIMTQKNDSVIVDSKNVSRDGTGYTQFPVSKSTFVGSFEDGMKMMAKGDSAVAIAKKFGVSSSVLPILFFLRACFTMSFLRASKQVIT